MLFLALLSKPTMWDRGAADPNRPFERKFESENLVIVLGVSTAMPFASFRHLLLLVILKWQWCSMVTSLQHICICVRPSYYFRHAWVCIFIRAAINPCYQYTIYELAGSRHQHYFWMVGLQTVPWHILMDQFTVKCFVNRRCWIWVSTCQL